MMVKSDITWPALHLLKPSTKARQQIASQHLVMCVVPVAEFLLHKMCEFQDVRKKLAVCFCASANRVGFLCVCLGRGRLSLHMTEPVQSWLTCPVTFKGILCGNWRLGMRGVHEAGCDFPVRSFRGNQYSAVSSSFAATVAPVSSYLTPLPQWRPPWNLSNVWADGGNLYTLISHHAPRWSQREAATEHVQESGGMVDTRCGSTERKA